jgi:hypothetical protein
MARAGVQTSNPAEVMARTYADLSVEELTYLWLYSTLDESVDEAAELLVKAGLATEQRGVSEDVLNATDARLGRRCRTICIAFIVASRRSTLVRSGSLDSSAFNLLTTPTCAGSRAPS